MLMLVDFWFLLSISSSVSLKCKPGQYKSNNNCISCPKGAYQSDFGKSFCWNCYEGYYSNVTGSTKCQPCPKGHWCDKNNKGKAPIPCPKGTHQDKSGKPFCSICSPGYYSNREGSLYCTICPSFVILTTQEKDQFHAQREPGKPNLENHSVWVAVLDIIAVGRGHCTAQFVQKVTGVLTQEKDQFHAQKEHIKINLEDGIVRVVVLDIIAIGKDHCTAELVQKVTFVILMTEEKHQFHA